MYLVYLSAYCTISFQLYNTVKRVLRDESIPRTTVSCTVHIYNFTLIYVGLLELKLSRVPDSTLHSPAASTEQVLRDSFRSRKLSFFDKTLPFEALIGDWELGIKVPASCNHHPITVPWHHASFGYDFLIRHNSNAPYDHVHSVFITVMTRRVSE